MKLWVVAVAVSSVLTLSSGAKAAPMTVRDATVGAGQIGLADANSANGVMHVINKVLSSE